MATPFWTTVFHYTYARGYIRIPIVLGIPIIFNKYMLNMYESSFQRWNAGHNQMDIWNRLKAKVEADGGQEEQEEE